MAVGYGLPAREEGRLLPPASGMPMPNRSTLSFEALLRDVVGKGIHSYPLTRREQEIVYLLVQGYANKEIAERCHIAEQTVKDHLKHIYQKVGVHQRSALIAQLVGTTSRC